MPTLFVEEPFADHQKHTHTYYIRNYKFRLQIDLHHMFFIHTYIYTHLLVIASLDCICFAFSGKIFIPESKPLQSRSGSEPWTHAGVIWGVDLIGEQLVLFTAGMFTAGTLSWRHPDLLHGVS